MPKKRNEQNFYFTKEVENEIIQYCLSDVKKTKNDLYNHLIGKTLKELIDNIVQVYKLGTLPNIAFLKEECLLYLITVLSKYNPNKISKRTGKTSAAFTYFTVVAKNWFFLQHKKCKKQKYEEVNIDEVFDLENSDNISDEHEYELLRTRDEFKKYLMEEMSWWGSDFSNNSEVIKVVNALIYLIEKAEDLEFLDKRGIYVYLRELSGLETKDISPIIKKLYPILKEFLTSWKNSEI